MATAADGLPWPPPNNQLEKWMMNTCKEGDHAAQLMRSILNMNPAFGVYLQEDQDLVSVVQLFAKRFRKISLAEGSAQMSPTVLYQPLCEMVWRVVGLTMHTMLNLNDQSALPVVKEAQGMVKMLLQTNTELSNQLNQLRRKYFKELTAYRDKSRRLSKQAEHAINALQEQPIMFFEPLEFVLDETTKAFVREAIEERMKLEIRTAFKQEDGNAEIAIHMEQIEKDLQEAQAKVRVLNNTVAREAEVRKRHEETEKKLREEIKKLGEGGTDTQKEMIALQEQLAKAKEEADKQRSRIKFLEEEKKAPAEEKVVTDHGAVSQAAEEAAASVAAEKDEEIDKLQQALKKLEAQMKQKDAEIKKAESKVEETQQAMKSSGKKVTEIVKEKKVFVEDTESKAQLEKSLEVEKQLREALRASEMRAKEAEEKAEKTSSTVVTVEKKVKVKKERDEEDVVEAAAKKPKKDNTDKKIQEAIDKCTEEFQGKIKTLSEKLKAAKEALEEKEAQIADLTGADKDAKKAAKKAAEDAARRAANSEDAEKWKVKYHELEDKFDDLQHEYDKMQAQVQGLVAKMGEKMSDEEIKATMMKIDLVAPPPRKKRKKKAYERLYDDAQRRIVEMRMKQEKMRALEEKAVRKVVSKVHDRQSLRKAEVLTHLHKASVATTERFQNALSEFHDTVPDKPGTPAFDEMEESSDPDEGIASEILRQRRRLMERNRTVNSQWSDSTRDLSPENSQSLPVDYVCPRCGYHTTSLYGKQSPTSTGQWNPTATGPVGNSTIIAPPFASGGVHAVYAAPFASAGPFAGAGVNAAPFTATFPGANAGGSASPYAAPMSMSGTFAGPLTGALLNSTPGTPPWISPGGPAVAGVQGQRLLHTTSASSLGSGLGNSLGRNPTSIPSGSGGALGDSSSVIGRPPSEGRSRSPGEQAGRTVSPTTSLALSPMVLASQQGAGVERASFGTGASLSRSNTRPWDMEPAIVSDLAVRGETPTSAKHERTFPSGLLPDAADGNTSSAAERAVFPSAPPPWRTIGLDSTFGASVGVDGRSLSPSSRALVRDESAPPAARSSSPDRGAGRAEQVGSASVAAPELGASIGANSGGPQAWFGLQATPPWRRGVSSAAAGTSASAAFNSAGGNDAGVRDALAATAPAPGTGPRAAGGRGRRSVTDLPGLPGRARGMSATLDPIRQVSFAAGEDQSRQRPIHTAPDPNKNQSRSPSPELASKSDGFLKKQKSDLGNIGSPARLRSAPTRSTSENFSEPLAEQFSTNSRGSDGGGQFGAQSFGGGGRGNKYGHLHSQELPSVTSVRSVPHLPVAGREIPADTLKDQPWESVRRIKGFKKSALAVQAVARMHADKPEAS